MPAAALPPPAAPASGAAGLSMPPDPNAAAGPSNSAGPSSGGGGGAAGISKGDTPPLEPAPAVINSSSHTDGHVLPRRFLGPIPDSVVTDSHTKDQRRAFRRLRRKTLAKLEGGDELGIGARGAGLGRAATRAADAARKAKIRVRRRNDADNSEHTVDLDVDQLYTDSSSSDDEGGGWLCWRKKKDGTPRARGNNPNMVISDMWVGNSFDIGREFETVGGEPQPDPGVAGAPDDTHHEVVRKVKKALEGDRPALGIDTGKGNDRDREHHGEGGAPDDGTATHATVVTTKSAPMRLQMRDGGENKTLFEVHGGNQAAVDELAPHPPHSSARAASDNKPDTTKAPPETAPDVPGRQDSDHKLGSSGPAHVTNKTLVDEPQSYFSTPPRRPKSKSSTPDAVATPGSFLSATARPGLRVGPGSFVTARTPQESPLRPAIPASMSTQETFMTARSGSHDSVDSNVSNHSSFSFTAPRPPALVLAPSTASQMSSSPGGKSGRSHMSQRPLIEPEDGFSLSPPHSTVPPRQHSDLFKKRSAGTQGTGGSIAGSSKKIKQRLKSALRNGRPRGGSNEDNQTSRRSPPKAAKTVQFPVDFAEVMPEDDEGQTVRQGNKAPADPADVLTRSGDEVAGTSSEAQGGDFVIDNDDFMPGGVVMRDRVLIRVGRHREEPLRTFDEPAQRRNPCERFDPFEEYIAGLTMTSLDLYQDWHWWITEKVKGHKRLRYSIPLSLPTSLSIFNQRDTSLCVTCPWETVLRHTLRYLDGQDRSQTSRFDRVKNSKALESLGMGRTGTAVFVIKFGERSRALDWHWYIAGQLDYRLPKQVDIRIPSLSQTVRMPIPDEAASSTVNRASTIKLLWDVTLANRDHAELLRQLGRIPRLDLAWKNRDASLDWVAYSTTVTGRNREWALLASFAHAHDEHSRRTLEIREANHHRNRVYLEDGQFLQEPPGVEGYLIRRPAGPSQSQVIYVSTNDGLVFISAAHSGVPPLHPKPAGTTPADVFPELHKQFLISEKRRMAAFIERCTGCLNFCDIVSVNLVQPQNSEQPSTKSPTSPTSPLTRMFSRTPALRKPHSDQPLIKREGKRAEREFDIALYGGYTVIRLEAHTPALAAEWVERLSALAQYWSMRGRVDARQTMDAVKYNRAGRDAFVDTADPATEKILNHVWNWCIIDGCRAVTLSGWVFIRRGAFAYFRSCYLVLTNGCLVTFRVKGSVGLQPRRMVYPLFGAYVYSGLLATDELVQPPQESAFNPSARVYPDGLQTTDGAEDTTFVVRITWPTGRWAKTHPWDDKEQDEHWTPPPLRDRPAQLLICRARSKLERDRWVWAINAEMERYARAHIRQEEKLRNTGTLPRHQTLVHQNVSGNSTRRNSSSCHRASG